MYTFELQSSLSGKGLKPAHYQPQETAGGGKKHGGIVPALDGWYRTAKSAKWASLEEIRQTYASADGVPVGERVYTVFNIRGNNFRLVTEIYHADQVLLIRHVLTHAEYDKGDWKKE